MARVQSARNEKLSGAGQVEGVNLNLRAPRYAQVYAVLRDWVLQGVYAPGQRMPSESELCDSFDVSRITVRAAVEMLEKEGLVQRIQGRGTFVRADLKDVPGRGDLSELVRRVRQLDARSTPKDVRIEDILADDLVARDLQVERGEPLTHASYVRLRDGEPVGVADIYVPKRLGVTLDISDFKEPSPTLLERKGVELLGAHQLLGAALADAKIASRLSIPVGAPVVQVRLLVLAVSSQPVELLLAHYRADRYVHHVFLAARSS